MESGISENLNLKSTTKNKVFTTPVLYKSDTDTIEYSIILDEYPTKVQLHMLIKFFNKHLTNYQLLYALQLELNETDKKKTVWKFYRDNKWRFENYIPQWSKILSFGKSIFSICESNDLDCSIKMDDVTNEKKDLDKNSIIAGFYDTLLNETHFNDPKTKCVVFPVDCYTDLVNNDTDSFYDKFEYWFLKEQLKKIVEYKIKPLKIRQLKVEYINNPNEWLQLQIDSSNTINPSNICSFDLETDGLDMFSDVGYVLNISISYYENPYNSYYLSWNKTDIKLLEKFLLSKSHIGTNLNYDYKWIIFKYKLSIKLINKLIGDTMHQAQIVNTLQRIGLKSCVWISGWHGGYDQELDRYIESHPECKAHYSLIPEKLRIPYAGMDASQSLLVHKYFEDKMKEIDKKYPVNFIPNSHWSMINFYNELRIPALKVFCRAEIRGMEVNWDKVKELSDYVRKEIEEKTLKIRNMLGITDPNFNINSNDQLGQLLQKLGWKNYGLTKKKIYNVAEYQLTHWQEDGHEEAKLIDDVHKLNTLYKTFIGSEEEGNGYYQYRKNDNRIHFNHGVGLTNNARNFGRNPNPQNIKKHGYLALELRDMISVQDENEFCLVEQDGNGLQLRVETSLSSDSEMLYIFKNNLDMHAMTSFLLFEKKLNCTFEEYCKKIKEKDHEAVEIRYSGKSPNFSLCFGSSSLSFAKESLHQGTYKWSFEQAKSYVELHKLQKLRNEKYERLIENPNIHDSPEVFSYYWACAEDIREKWMKKYNGIEKYIASQIKIGEKYGACFTPYGFIRRVPWLIYCKGEDEDKRRTKNMQNVMSNVCAQTVEWVKITKTMIAQDKIIEDNNYKSYIITNVHDSVVSKMYYDEMYEIVKAGQQAFSIDEPENKSVPYILEFDGGIWGFGCSFELNQLKDIVKTKEKIKLNNIKMRQKMIYKKDN